MQMDDKIAHHGIIDRLLRFRLPSRIGGRVVWKNPDNVDPIEILEFNAVELFYLAAEHEMEQLFLRSFVRHDSILPPAFWPGRSGEFLLAIADEAKQPPVPRLTCREERWVCRVGTIVEQGMPRQGGQPAASFVHQKVGGCKVPVARIRAG